MTIPDSVFTLWVCLNCGDKLDARDCLDCGIYAEPVRIIPDDYPKVKPMMRGVAQAPAQTET